MGTAEKPAENSGSEGLVTSQQLNPVTGAFGGGDHDAATAITLADEAKGQAGVLAVVRIVAHLVDP